MRIFKSDSTFRRNIKRLLSKSRHVPMNYDESHVAGSHFVLSYSNFSDCLRWNLEPLNYSPWNWASNWVLAMSRPTSGDRLLDLGCIDNPYIVGHCKKHNIDTTFVDIAPKPPDVKLPGNITFVQSDLNRALPFKDESFDVILSESSLEHLPPDGRLNAFQEAIRCLRPGGRLAVSIGFPLGFGNDPDTIHAFETHEFFSHRHCCLFLPIDIKKIIDRINDYTAGNLNYPYNHSNFPGFSGYNDEHILKDPNIVFTRFKDLADVPNVARLRSSLRLGYFFTSRLKWKVTQEGEIVKRNRDYMPCQK
jgi:SAM-dependent methyltransferase